jgi:hypothetical protein
MAENVVQFWESRTPLYYLARKVQVRRCQYLVVFSTYSVVQASCNGLIKVIERITIIQA